MNIYIHDQSPNITAEQCFAYRLFRREGNGTGHGTGAAGRTGQGAQYLSPGQPGGLGGHGGGSGRRGFRLRTNVSTMAAAAMTMSAKPKASTLAQAGTVTPSAGLALSRPRGRGPNLAVSCA
jgi:hypothetical protein